MEDQLFEPLLIRDGGLLQSAEWQAFQAALGRRVFTLGADDFSGRGALLSLPLIGNYLYFPRGPLVRPGTERLPHFHMQLLGVEKEAGIAWARVEPQAEAELAVLQRTFGEKLVKAPRDVQPRETLLIDLTAKEEELLAWMKPKTRYNVRLAEKHGVEVRESRSLEDFPLFEELLNATAERKGIRTHPSSYYRKMLESLPDHCRLFFAEFEGRALAANLLMFVGDTATYLHGGSCDEARDIMAPFLLQWEQIRAAKREGFRRYDLGGVKVVTRGERGDWDGITRFKRGFAPGTDPLLFPGAYDIILDASRYQRYRFFRSLRRLIP